MHDYKEPVPKLFTTTEYCGPHVKSEKSSEIVKRFHSAGIKAADIAAYLDVSLATLKNHYQKELTQAKVETCAQIGSKVVHQALNEACRTSQIFYLKTQAGWSEKLVQDLLDENTKIKEELLKLREELDSENIKEY
jgi:hypothetical protein